MLKETTQSVFGTGDAGAPYEHSEESGKPRVILITPTYRDPQGNQSAFKARYEGLMSVYRQFLEQDYPEDRIELRIFDSSAASHPFFDELDDPRVKYLHIPDRTHESKRALVERYPEAEEFFLTDEDMRTPAFRSKIAALQEFCSKRTDPVSARLIPSIADPLEIKRPSIGMMRNVLCALPFASGQEEPDIIIAMDDDDWHSANYTKNTVKNLQNAAWTKLVNYHLAIVVPDEGLHWGKKEFGKVSLGAALPAIQFSKCAMIFNSATGLKPVAPEDAFNSPRWHPLSTDGTVHAMRYTAWKRVVDLFDGFVPVSYNEDTLMFEALRLLGNLDRREEVCRDPLILKGLTGGRIYTKEEIERDRNNGSVTLYPIFEDKRDFARLCCANVSPVAFSQMVPESDVPEGMRKAFDFLFEQPNNAPARYRDRRTSTIS